MGSGPQYVIAQLNDDGVPVPIGPDNPLKISGGGGGGAVNSVNGQTGVVELDASDVGAAVAPTIGYLEYPGSSSGSGGRVPVFGNNSSLSYMRTSINEMSASMLVVRDNGGQVWVPTTPTSNGYAASKYYVDLRVPVPPATGGPYTLQSLDGVQTWVAA